MSSIDRNLRILAVRMTDEQVEAVAQVCHEANRAYCRVIGDHSQVPWNEAPQWQRDSAIVGVRFVIENPDALPGEQHECWLSMKVRDGWRWGPEKDPVAKLHPCCVPYPELPLEQRRKDFLFGAIVRAVTAVD